MRFSDALEAKKDTEKMHRLRLMRKSLEWYWQRGLMREPWVKIISGHGMVGIGMVAGSIFQNTHVSLNWFVQFLTWGRTYLKTSCLVSWWLPDRASWLADFWLATVWRHRFIFLADGIRDNRCVHKLLHTHYLTGSHMRIWWHDDSISNISACQTCQMAYPDPLEMHESPLMNEIDKQCGNTVHVLPRTYSSTYKHM